MRIAIGILTTAATLFLAGALGFWGTWALATASVLGLIGTTWAVTALEQRDNEQVIASALSVRRSAPSSAVGAWVEVEGRPAPRRGVNP